MTVAMAVNKRCAASGRTLQAKSAASEIQHVKIQLWQTFQNRSKYMHERRFVLMSLLQCHMLCQGFLTLFSSSFFELLTPQRPGFRSPPN